ncbi:MAG: hypothetical protein WA064_01125 [Candidatus Moraniibacteriota bacterium]
MNTKKVAIIALALVALIGGVFIITRNIISRESISESTQNPAIAKKEPVNLFGQGANSDDKTKETTEVIGVLNIIGDKTITVKSSGADSAVVNINGATPVMLLGNDNKATSGQMADLRIGNTVRVVYEKITKNARMIFVTKPQEATTK